MGDAPLLGGLCRLRRAARRRWRFGGLADQIEEAVTRVFPIAILGSETVGADHKNPLPGQPSARKPGKPCPYEVIEVQRAGHVETQLHGGRNLIDVLTSRAEARMKLSTSSASSIAMRCVMEMVGMISA